MAVDPNESEKQLGTGSTLRREGTGVVLHAGAQDVVVITQVHDALHLIVNGQDSVKLTPQESAKLEVRGNRAGVFADKTVKGAIRGLVSAAPQKPSAGAGARLAKARQKSSAFGAALAQQRIVADFKKDPFLVGIGEQLQRLAAHFGGKVYRPSAPNAPSDLLPLFTELARTLQFQAHVNPPVEKQRPDYATEDLLELFLGLHLALENTVGDIRRGQDADLDSVASQVTEILARLYPGKWKFEAGKVTPEMRSFRPGMDTKLFYEKSDALNTALASADPEKQRDTILAGEAVTEALEQEKLALLKGLCERGKKPQPAESRAKYAQAINRVLYSSGSSEEFQRLVQSVTIDSIRSIGGTGTIESADFDMAAGAFGCHSYAADPVAAKLATEALACGFLREQILQARRKVQQVYAEPGDEFLESLANSSLHMLLCTPQEKAEVVRRLNEGRPAKRDNRAVVAVLESAANATEFAAILDLEGDAEAASKLQDPDSAKKFSRLAGAYDLSHLALDANAAKSAHRLLASAASPQKHGQYGSAVEPRENPVFEEIERRIEKQLLFIDRRAIVNSVLINSERQKDGVPPLNVQSLRQKADAILRDTSLPEKQRKSGIEDLAKTERLQEDHMRSLLLPLCQVYEQAVEEAQELAASFCGPAREKARRLKSRHGSQNEAAIAAKGKLTDMESALESFYFRLNKAAKLLNDMYCVVTEGIRRGALRT